MVAVRRFGGGIMMQKGVYFITGIDTDIGKTVATGFLAQQLLAQGVNVITQKLIQTGNQGYSEDIAKHRQIMGKSFLEDEQGLTAPQIFTYPASPHLAVQLENKTLDIAKITRATAQLKQDYDVVLLEGAGGLMVPLTSDMLTIDYVAEQDYPIVLVTSGRLGSINHTLLSILAIQQYQLELKAVVFNAIHDSQDEVIATDTREYLQHYLQKVSPKTQWIELAKL